MNREHQTRKKVIKNLPHFWMYAIGSGVIALLLQLISLIPSLIMQRIVDRYIPEGNLKKNCHRDHLVYPAPNPFDGNVRLLQMPGGSRLP